MSDFIIAGIKCQAGDIIECLNVPFPEHAERYHVVLRDGTTRDLGNNNENMWCFWLPIRNLGRYDQHPNIFDKEDEDYYFGAKA